MDENKMNFKNIRNVTKLNSDLEEYSISLDVDFNGNGTYVPTVYCTRIDGDEFCNHILNEIKLGNFEGTISTAPELTIEEKLNDLTSSIRRYRNNLLLKSDWTQLPDVPPETKIKWMAYRQALRNITDQPKFPNEVIWPAKPE